MNEFNSSLCEFVRLYNNPMSNHVRVLEADRKNIIDFLMNLILLFIGLVATLKLENKTGL